MVLQNSHQRRTKFENNMGESPLRLNGLVTARGHQPTHHLVRFLDDPLRTSGRGCGATVARHHDRAPLVPTFRMSVENIVSEFESCAWRSRRLILLPIYQLSCPSCYFPSRLQLALINSIQIASTMSRSSSSLGRSPGSLRIQASKIVEVVLEQATRQSS